MMKCILRIDRKIRNTLSLLMNSTMGVILKMLAVLSRFLAHAPLSSHEPLLEYRRTEVNRNIYNIGTPAFLISS